MHYVGRHEANKHARERAEQEKKQDSEKKTLYEKHRAEELARINAEIDRVKNANTGVTSEQWRIGLSERYAELQNVINTNIPEIWPGLEFELSSLRILNIHDCDLPFIGLILARPIHPNINSQTFSSSI